MRPIKLYIEGINSFTDEQVVDFEAAGADNLFCISGPTGSGKTTVLDGMILSLYRGHSERGNLVDYINLRRESGRLKFVFELDGDVYVTERVISRKAGKNSFLLSRGGERLLEGDKAYDFIEAKLGLEVKEFVSVVVLQQGEFAKFLKSTKSVRLALIGKLFGLSKYGELFSRFNARAVELAARCEAENEALGRLGATDESAEALAKRAAECAAELEAAGRAAAEKRKLAEEKSKAREAFVAEQKLIADIEKKRAELVAAQKREENGRAYIAELAKRKAALALREKERDELVRRKTLAEQNALKAAAVSAKRERLAADKLAVSGLAERTAEAKRRLDEAEKREKEAELGTRAAAEAAGQSADVKEAEVAAALAACRRTGEDAERAKKNIAEAERALAAASAENDRLLTEWAEAGKMDGALKTAAEEKRKAADIAAAEYERAAENDALALVAAGLKRGDRCPVCGGTVDEVCRCERGADLTELKEKRDAAAAEAVRAEKNSAESAARMLSLAERKRSAEKRMSETDETLRSARKAYSEEDERTNAAKERALTSLAESLTRQAAVRAEAEAPREEYRKSAASLAAEEKAIAARERELAEEEKNVAPPMSEEEKREIEEKLAALTADREKLESDDRRANELMAELAGSVSRLSGEIKADEGRIKGAAEVSEEAAASARAEAEAADKEAARLTAAVAETNAALKREREDLAAKKELAKRLKDLQSERDVYEKLVKMFKGNAFAEFAAAEYVTGFTDAASDKLSALTGGKYTLGYDEDKGEFYVTDFLSGNERRSAKTLSGGETFLASLALAISVSEELSKNRSFDFFFIDEGFGTLSGGALDAVMSALTALSRDTLVGVITHRSELIERIPTAIKVTPPDGEKGSVLGF